MERLGRPQLLGTLEVRIPGSDTHPRSGIQADTGAVGVQTSAAVVKVRPILVRLTAIEPGRFELRRMGEDSSSEDSERDMCSVLPMVRQRRQWVGGGRWTVGKGDGAKCGLADRREVE